MRQDRQRSQYPALQGMPEFVCEDGRQAEIVRIASNVYE